MLELKSKIFRIGGVQMAIFGVDNQRGKVIQMILFESPYEERRYDGIKLTLLRNA